MVLVLFSLLMMVVAVAAGAAMGIGTPKGGGPWGPWLVWQALSQVLMFALPSLAVVWTYYRAGWRQWLRLDFGGRRWLLALAGVVVMLLLIPLTDWLNTWNDALHLPGALKPVEESLRRAGEESQGLLQSMMREVSPWASLLCVALVPAVCEELFFRAGIQNLLQRWTGNVHVAVWATAAVFSLAHFEIFSFLPRFLLGALLGYLYVYGRSLLVNVLAHFANNAIVVVTYALMSGDSTSFDPSAPLALSPLLTLACTLAAVALLVVVFGKTRNASSSNK